MNSIINKEDIDDSIYYDRYLQIKKQYINAKENVQTGGLGQEYIILQLNEEQYNKLLMFYAIDIKTCEFDIKNFIKDNGIKKYNKDYFMNLRKTEKSAKYEYIGDDDFTKNPNSEHILSVLNKFPIDNNNNYFIIVNDTILGDYILCSYIKTTNELYVFINKDTNTFIAVLNTVFKINTKIDNIVKYIDNIKTEGCFKNLKTLLDNLDNTNYKILTSQVLPTFGKDKYIMGLCAFLKALVLNEQNILDIILNKCTEYGISSFVNKYYEGIGLKTYDTQCTDTNYDNNKLIYSIVKIISSEYTIRSTGDSSALTYYKAISGKISWLGNDTPDTKPENVINLLYVIMLCDSKYKEKNEEHSKYNPPLLCAYKLVCNEQVYSKFLYKLIDIYNKENVGLISKSYIFVLKPFINKIYDLFTYLNDIKTENETKNETETKPIEHIRVSNIIEKYGKLIIDSQQQNSISSYDTRFYENIHELMSNVSEIIMKYIDNIVLYKSKGIKVAL